MDFILAYIDYSVIEGKFVVYIKKNLQLGEEKPYKPP